MTTPPKEAEAGSRFNVVPDMVAPLALGVDPIAAMVVTPDPLTVDQLNVAIPEDGAVDTRA